MKPTTFVLILCLFAPVFANAESSTRAEFESHLDGAGDIEPANLGNGGYSWLKYDVSKFSVQSAIKAMVKEQLDETTDCQFDYNGNFDVAFKSLGDRGEASDPVMAGLLLSTKNRNELKGVVSQTWDGASGDSVYCSIYRYTIYLNDGNALYLSYEHTD